MCIVVALGRLVATPEGEMPVVASTVDLLIPTEPSKLKSSVKRTYTALRCRASSLLLASSTYPFANGFSNWVLPVLVAPNFR